jgi:hypothetical protein
MRFQAPQSHLRKEKTLTKSASYSGTQSSSLPNSIPTRCTREVLFNSHIGRVYLAMQDIAPNRVVHNQPGSGRSPFQRRYRPEGGYLDRTSNGTQSSPGSGDNVRTGEDSWARVRGGPSRGTGRYRLVSERRSVRHVRRVIGLIDVGSHGLDSRGRVGLSDGVPIGNLWEGPKGLNHVA